MSDPIYRVLVEKLRSRAEWKRKTAADDERRAAAQRELAKVLDLVAISRASAAAPLCTNFDNRQRPENGSYANGDDCQDDDGFDHN